MTTNPMKMGISAPRVVYVGLLVISYDCLADAPLEASDCPYDEMTDGGANYRNWQRRASAAISREFLFDDEERANRAKALRPKPKDRD